MNKQKHIVIVDDDPGIQDAIRMILEHTGYGITVFSNGDRLLSGDFDVPDLFILDKQLPGVDGLDICRHLKSSEKTRQIPVLILSASPHVARMAESAAADGFLEKPFQMKVIRKVVEKLLNVAQFDT